DDEHALLHEHIAVYHVHGALFFGGVRPFLDHAAADVRVAILDLSAVRVMDSSGAVALIGLVDRLRRAGIIVLLAGLSPGHHRLAESVGLVASLGERRHLFADLPAAVAHGRNHVRYANGECWLMSCEPALTA